MMRHFYLLAAVVLMLAGAARAQLGPAQDLVTVSTHWSQSQAAAGDQRILAVVLEISEGFHINPDEARAAENLIPTVVTVEAADAALQVGPVQYPKPHDVTVNYTGKPQQIPVYEGRTVLYVPVIVGADAALGETAVTVAVRYQACNDRLCYPPRNVAADAALTVVPKAQLQEPAEPAEQELFAEFDSAEFDRMAAGEAAGEPATDASAGTVRFDAFGYAFTVNTATNLGLISLLLMAAVGGGLLNFTPCVLPVVPLKIMGISAASSNRGRCLTLGAAMSLGVVAFWLVLGLVIATISGFTATNQLFQYPAFTVTVGVVIAVMAVGMCGLFAVRLPQFVYRFTPRQETLRGSFGFGVMTAVLATPCTGPFMGAAAAWAATQQPVTTLSTFMAIGVGMALPYMVLSANPAWAQRLPRTGPASELIKQIMGLLMLAAAAYFAGVGISGLMMQPGEDPSVAYWWPVMGFIAAAGAWLGWRTWRITSSMARRFAMTAVAGVAIAGSMYSAAALTERGPIDWVQFTPERLEQALDRGEVVVMDFTAEWCINCKFLEYSVLHQGRVVELLAEDGVLPMKVDLTGSNPDGSAQLQAAGRVAIPLLVVYAPDGSEVFKSDAYTAQQVIDAVAEARRR